MKIYVIHYDKLVDRKDVLENKLKENDLSAEWLIQRGYYDQTFIDKYYEYNKKEWKRKVKIANRPIIYRPLIKSEVHLTINHFLIGEKIISGNDEYALVLEDDAMLVDDFKNKLDEVVVQLNNMEWDIAYLDYLGAKPPKVDKLTLFPSRNNYDYFGTCAYIIKKSAWTKIIKTDDKFTLPIDEEYKYRINLLGLKTVWAVPPLVKQSSLDESNNTNSGQDQRDKEGLKKYIYWRQNIYKLFPKKFKKKIYKLEEKVKKIMLGIK